MKLSRFISNAILGAAMFGMATGLWGTYAIASKHDEHQQTQVESATDGVEQPEETAKVVWTCSMHPQIQLPHEGKCPLCFMDLIKLEIDANKAAAESYRQIELSGDARKLAEIEVTPVSRSSAAATLRMVGKVDYDESHVGSISAWTDGRIDRLHIAKTGSFVRKGQPMAAIYSPELYAAQAELIQAVNAQQKLTKKSSSLLRKSVASNISAAKEKLHLLGLTDGQIAAISKQRTPAKNLTIRAPQAGIVIRKDVVEGAYVKTGQPIYSIADLSAVWVVLEAYEKDLPWVKEGDSVTFIADAFPGEEFSGRIVYIDPMVNQQTRTVDVRLEVKNPNGKLKPGMFVQASRTMDKTASESALLIPASAPLITGKRAVVYVQNPEKEGVYEGREIVLGARSGDSYIVKSGLAEGDLVVSNGAFKLDSALQIMAKPSMMSGTAVSGSSSHGGGDAKEHDHLGAPPLLVSQLYFMDSDFKALTRALQQSDTAAAKKLFAKIGNKLSSMETWMLEGEAKLAWKEHAMLLANDCVLGAEADSFKRQHEMYALAAKHYNALRNAFGVDSVAASLTPTMVVPDAVKAQLGEVLVAYVTVSEALSKDNPEAARAAVGKLSGKISAVSSGGMNRETAAFWAKEGSQMAEGAEAMLSAGDISAMRTGFQQVSNALLAVTKKMGVTLNGEVYEVHCPMAFDNTGASWLQQDANIRNPYFGAAMFMCGEVKSQLAAE